MIYNYILLIGAGVFVGIGASFSGLGGGFLMIPLLLYLGFSAQEAVGTSFLAIFIISVSAVFAHSKLSHVNYITGLLLGAGGVIGAQIGAKFIDNYSTVNFKKIFAIVLVLLASYVFFKK